MAKCDYRYCFCSDDDLNEDNTVVTKSKKKFHTDCYNISQDILKVRDYYYKVINKNSMQQVVKVINDLVLFQGVEPEFLYFALKYCAKNGISIRSPIGMTYVIKYPSIIKAYEEHKRTVEVNRIKEESNKIFTGAEQKETVFKHTPDKVGFGSIFERMGLRK